MPVNGAVEVGVLGASGVAVPEPVVLAPLLDSDSLSDKRVLIVDDVSDSGRTLAMVVDLVARSGADARSVCLYSKPGTVLEPDFAWKSTTKWIDFPWSSLPPVTA